MMQSVRRERTTTRFPCGIRSTGGRVRVDGLKQGPINHGEYLDENYTVAARDSEENIGVSKRDKV